VLKQVLPGYTPEFRTNLSGSNQLSATTTATPNQAFAEARLHPQLGQPPRLHPLLHLPLLLQPVDVPTYLIGPILMEMTVPGMKVSETARSGDKLEPMMRAVCVEEDQMTGQHPAPIHLHQPQHPLLLLLQPVDVPTYLIGPILMEMTVPGMKVSETARSGDKLEPMMRAVCVEEDQMTGQHPAPIHQRQVQWPLPQLLMYVRTMMRSSSTHHQYRKIANLWEGLTHQIVAIGQE